MVLRVRPTSTNFLYTPVYTAKCKMSVGGICLGTVAYTHQPGLALYYSKAVGTASWTERAINVITVWSLTSYAPQRKRVKALLHHVISPYSPPPLDWGPRSDNVRLQPPGHPSLRYRYASRWFEGPWSSSGRGTLCQPKDSGQSCLWTHFICYFHLTCLLKCI